MAAAAPPPRPPDHRRDPQAAAASSRGTAERQVDARLRIHVIVTRHQAPHAVLPLIVCLRSAGWRQPLIALLVLIAKHPDQHAGHWVARFVIDVPGDHAAARKTEVDVLDLLPVRELQRRSRLQRPALAIRERHKA
jgi:hypothetical protein